MSFTEFFNQMLQNPMLFVSTLLTLGVILVTGWTDAPNAIATCVSTRAIGVRPAIIMASIFNFFGVLIMTALNASVAMTIYNMVDFGGDARIAQRAEQLQRRGLLLGAPGPVTRAGGLAA